MIRPGRPRTTLKTLARHLGLSVTTVSRALKEGPEVRPATIRRVRAAAEELGYRPNPSGLGLKTGRTHVLALILPVIRPGEVVGDVGTGPLIEGLTAALAGTPYHLTVIPSRPEENELAPVRYVVEHGLADGVILTITRPQDERVQYLASLGVPFVTFGRTELALRHAFVDIDNGDFARRAADWLLDRGRRRLRLLLPAVDYLYSWHRRVGFQRALQTRGLDFDAERQLISEAEALDYRALARRLADDPDGPDGLICGTEVAALGLQAGLADAGAECELVTLETSPLADSFPHPVSGFRQDLHRVGRELGRLLLASLAGETAMDKLQVIETAQFINRTDRTIR